MFKVKAFIIAGLLMGTPAVAQEPASGMSEASRQLVRDNMTERNAELAPLLAKKRELQARFDGLLTPETYDPEALAATMAEMRDVEGQIVEKMGSSLRALLEALPDEDRAHFFRTMTKTPPAAAAASEPAEIEAGPGR